MKSCTTCNRPIRRGRATRCIDCRLADLPPLLPGGKRRVPDPIIEERLPILQARAAAGLPLFSRHPLQDGMGLLSQTDLSG